MPKRSHKPPATPPPSLASQKSDFTAEGSPPPGLVATEGPVTAPTGPDAARLPGCATLPAERPARSRRR